MVTEMQSLKSIACLLKGVESSAIVTFVISGKQVPTGTRTLSGPEFQVLHPDGMGKTSWVVDFSLQIGRDGTKAAVGVYLRNLSGASEYFSGQGLRCSFGIYFCGKDEYFHGVKGTRTFRAMGSYRGWAEFISVADLQKRV